MNLTSINTTQPTMTSRDIAELVDSRHDDVKQSIERLAERGAISLPPLGEVNVERERWQELEARAPQPADLNLRNPRQLAAAARMEAPTWGSAQVAQPRARTPGGRRKPEQLGPSRPPFLPTVSSASGRVLHR